LEAAEIPVPLTDKMVFEIPLIEVAKRFGLVISMSSYDTSPLASGENDGIQMTKFLSENCKFDVTHIHDASPSEISSAFSALDAKLALAKMGHQKLLLLSIIQDTDC